MVLSSTATCLRYEASSVEIGGWVTCSIDRLPVGSGVSLSVGVKQNLCAAEQRHDPAAGLVSDLGVPNLGGPSAMHEPRLAPTPPSRAVPKKFALSSAVVNPTAPFG